MRLSTRLALVTAVIVPVLVSLTGLLLLGLVGRDLQTGQDGQLRQRAAASLPTARSVLRAADTGRTRQEATQQHRLTVAALDVGVRLVRADGTLLIAEGPQPDTGAALPSKADRLKGASGNPVTVTVAGTSWRMLTQSVTGAAAQPAGTLYLFAPASGVTDEAASVRRRILLVVLIAAPLGGLLAYPVAERAVRPLRNLQRRTSGLDPDDPARRFDLGGRPTGVTEVDQLAGTLQTVLHRYDEQAARTAEALETARAFAASASHELRTPLMSMRTNLDILGDHPGLDPADRAEVLGDLQAEHARMLGLLTALRALANGDLVEGDSFGTVDLVELVESAASGARRRDPGATVVVRSAPALRLRGWEPGLRMAVDNLLVNALVHGRGSSGAAELRIELRAERGQAVLTVDDSGPGVPPGQREAVFARFRRGPDSPGSGLGLTLVAQQIALHRGTVRLCDPPGGIGTRVELRLPLGAEAAPVDSSTTTLHLRRDWLTAERPAPPGPQPFHKEHP